MTESEKRPAQRRETESVAPAAGFSPLSLARSVWKWKLLVLSLWILVSGVAFVIVERLPAVYQADAVILVDSQKIPDKFVSSTVNANLQDRITNISQQILSSTRLKKTIDDFHLYSSERKSLYEEEILEKMRKDITIKLEQGYNKNSPGAFRISYHGSDPSVVAQVANRLASLFIEENLRAREVQAEGTSEFIDTQLQEAKKSLDQLEKAVSEYKVEHNGELPQQENSISSTLTRLQIELAANRDSTNRTQQSKVMLENALASSEATISTLKAAASQRVTVTTNASGATVVQGQAYEAPVSKKPSEIAQEKLREMRRTLGPLHPDVRSMNEEILMLQAQEKLEAAPKSAPTTSASASSTHPAAATSAPPQTTAPNLREVLDLTQLNERLSTLKAQIVLAERELETQKANQERIVRDLSSAEARLAKLPIREQEMAQVSRDYEMSKANYRSLLDKKFAAEMATDMEHRQKSERFTLLDAARTPEKPQKPNRPLLSAASSLGALAFGLFLAIGLERRRDVLLGEWELPEGIPVIARVPNIVVSGKATASPAARPRMALRLAIIFSVVTGLLGMAAAGWYYFVRNQ